MTAGRNRKKRADTCLSKRVMPQLDAEKEDSRGAAVLFSGFFAFRGG